MLKDSIITYFEAKCMGVSSEIFRPQA